MDIYCRTCMHQFNRNSIQNVEAFKIFHVSNLAEKLRLCLNQSVEPADDYPQSLCQKCYEKVCNFYEFQLMCKESLKTYKDILAIESNVYKSNQKTWVSTSDSTFSNENVDNSIEFNADDLIVEDDGSNIEFENTFDLKLQQQKNADAAVSMFNNASNDEGISPDVKEVPVEPFSEDDEKFDLEAENKDEYYCNLCPMVFPFDHCLKAHILQHEGLDVFRCTREKCTQTFNRLSDLRKHIRDHNSNPREIYKCDVDNCGKEFSTKSAINVHMRRQHNFGELPGSRKYICKVCGAHLANSRCLQDHHLLHIDRKHWPFACDAKDCSARFRKKNELMEHKNRHDGIKPYICPHCDKRFYTASNLSVHVNFHTQERKWPCHMCTRVFFTASNLKFHLQKEHEIDQKDIRYPCRLCDKSLSTQTARKHHEMTHTGNKPHICDVCGRGFINPSSLRKHKRIHLDADNSKEFTCNEYENAFTLITALENHEKNRNYCELCDLQFRSPTSLSRHQKYMCCTQIKDNYKQKHEKMILSFVDFRGQREMELD